MHGTKTGHGVARTLLAGAIGAALTMGLAACGSGGGSREDPPITVTPPVTPPTTPPPNPPPPTTPPIPQPAIDAHLALTNAGGAQRGGFTGAGYSIAILDTGVNRNHPALAGRVAANLTYVSNRNDLSVDDKAGHGTAVAQLAAGQPVGAWPGGVAPGATILSARIVGDERPTDDGSGQGNQVTGALGLKGIHQDLVARGMRIMNNSWGGLYWTDANATAAIADEYRFFIQNHDGLVVFSTGNEGRPTPTDMASLPSKAGPVNTTPAADLERGWLAVTALDTANPTQLASYANACGVAMRYCLAAPGTAVFTSHTDAVGSPTYRYAAGTSFAAPLVSGSAAVVWQKFPYFTNDLVRQTLLGTATDLGAPGPDAVFGYGLLNLEKALRGPGRFDWGDVTATVTEQGTGTTWSNAISGDGGLVKRGRGQLILSGRNTYTGGTRIEQGPLILRDGATLRSNVTIANAPTADTAILQFHTGGATVHGNVTNRGWVAQYEVAPGAVIDGNFVQEVNGRYSTAVGASPLHVTGDIALAGNLHFRHAIDGYIPASGESQTIMTAGGNVSGSFGSYSWADAFVLLSGVPVYTADSVAFRFSQVTVDSAASAAGLGPSALASAARVDAAFDVLDSRAPATRPAGFTAAAAQLQRVEGDAGLAASLDSLSGRAHALASAMTFDSIDMQRRALSAHFDSGLGQPRVAGAWSRDLGGGGQGGYAGSAFQLSGWMLGTDARIGGNGVLGFAFGETRASDGPAAGLDRTRDRQTQAQLYAGWQRGDAYLLGQFGSGRFDRLVDRSLLLGAAQYGVHTDYAGTFTTASLETGYRFGLGAASLTSYVGAEHARIERDGFSEEGGYGFGLRSGDAVSSRSQAIAGLRAEHAWRGVRLRGYAEWQQALSATGLDMQASFVGVDAWAPLVGQPALSGGLVGLSADAWLSPNARMSFGYDQRFGPRGDEKSVSLRYAFGF